MFKTIIEKKSDSILYYFMSSMNAANFGACYPSKSTRENWEKQWQSAGPSTSSSAAAVKINKQEEIDEIIVISDSSEEDNGQEAINESDGTSTTAEESVIGDLIDSRELLQEVLCPFENVQQFVKLSTIDEWEENNLWPMCISSCSGCLVAFRVHREDNLPTELCIDEINKLEKETIEFKHYVGTFKIYSILPHYRPIRDEDFDKWLDMLNNSKEKLPAIGNKITKKKVLLKQLKLAISTSILQRHLLPNPEKIFDGIIGQEQNPPIRPADVPPTPMPIMPMPIYFLSIIEAAYAPPISAYPPQIMLANIPPLMSVNVPPIMPASVPPIMPAFVDISPIIIRTDQFKNVCKLLDSKYANFKILSGLCILVEIEQIVNYSLKLPPMMTLVKHMLIPISFANFASTTNKKIHRMKPSMIQLHTRNGDGVPICSARFGKKSIKLPSEQLIQISLAIWAMNNIPIPTSEFIHRKAAEFREALEYIENIGIQNKAVKQKSKIVSPPHHFIGKFSIQRGNQNEPPSSYGNNNVQKKEKKKQFKYNKSLPY